MYLLHSAAGRQEHSVLAFWEGHCPTLSAILSLPLGISKPLLFSLFAIGNSFLNADYTLSGSQGEVADNLPSYQKSGITS